MLDYVHDRNRFASVIWFERRENLLTALLTRGELQGKPVRINLPADNERLIEAAETDKPLVLRERRDQTAGGDVRTLSLFPTKVGNDVRFAVAVDSDVSDPKTITEIVRVSKAAAPANEVFEELQRNSGKQFIPEIVTALFRGMYNELTGDNKDKRFRRLLGREYMEAEGIVPMLKNSLNGISPTSPLTFIAVD